MASQYRLFIVSFHGRERKQEFAKTVVAALEKYFNTGEFNKFIARDDGSIYGRRLTLEEEKRANAFALGFWYRDNLV